MVRRIPDLNPKKDQGQATLFDTWRFHAFFTTVPAEQRATVAADQVHRGHAVIENVHADLKASALAHLPSGVFNANAAWLVCAVMAFNLTRAAATLTEASSLARATTATIRRKIINVPARIATLGPPPAPAPARALALANRVVSALRHTLPTARQRTDLTTRPQPYEKEPQWKSRTHRRPVHAHTPRQPPWPKPDHPTQPIGGSRLSRRHSQTS